MTSQLWTLNDQLYHALRDIIEERSGLSLHLTDRKIFESKVLDQIRSRGFGSLQEYVDFLRLDRRGEREATFLIDLITNNETYFFREHAHFDLLKQQILPRLFQQQSTRPIKIWSAGCATGEEPYTIAIVAHELLQRYGQRAPRIQIIGTDIDMTALKRAAIARFSKNSFRGEYARIKNIYFDPVGTEWQLKPHLQQMVDFRHLNLVNGEYPAGDLNQVDIIFFRNVSIYFKADTNQQILSQLYETLAEGGILFPGITETLQYRSNPFLLQEKHNIFYLQKAPQKKKNRLPRRPSKSTTNSLKTNDIRPLTSLINRQSNARPRTNTSSSGDSLPKPALPPKKKVTLQLAIDYLSDNRFQKASTVLQELIDDKTEEEEAWLLLANVQFNRGNIDQSERLIQKVLAVNDIRAEAFLLLGMIKKSQGNYIDAQQLLQKALFLEGSLWVANFHLAEMYRIRNKSDNARREYMNTIRNIKKDGENEWELYFAGFSKDYVVQACEKNLQIL